MGIRVGVFASRQEDKRGKDIVVVITIVSKKKKKKKKMHPLLSAIFAIWSTFVLRVAVTLFCSQVLFLAALWAWENIRHLLFGTKSALCLDPKKWSSAKVAKAPISTAMHYDTPMTLYEQCKIGFFLVTGLFVLRVCSAIAWFCVAAAGSNFVTWRGRSREKNPVWFFFCEKLVRVGVWMMMVSFGFYRCSTFGKPARREQAKLLAANHVCMAEVVALFAWASVPSFVTRVENLSIPFFSGACRAAKAIVVDRDAAASRTYTLDEIKRRASSPDAAQLMIFPEGTTGNQLALFRFKRGAFEPGVAMQPVCFKFPYKHFNPAWTGRASGGNDMLDLLLRLGCQFVNRVEVAFLPVYQPNDSEKADPMLYAAGVARLMATVLQVPLSDASGADYAEAVRLFNAKRKAAKAAKLEKAVVNVPQGQRCCTTTTTSSHVKDMQHCGILRAYKDA